MIICRTLNVVGDTKRLADDINLVEHIDNQIIDEVVSYLKRYVNVEHNGDEFKATLDLSTLEAKINDDIIERANTLETDYINFAK